MTGLEEELLNVKIDALYNQSAACSPRNTISGDALRLKEAFKPLLSPQIKKPIVFQSMHFNFNNETETPIPQQVQSHLKASVISLNRDLNQAFKDMK